MSKKPDILKQEVIAKSRIFKIEALDLCFSNGEQRQFERLISSRSAVVIVPFLDSKTILLIREYAAGVDRYELTFPKGVIDQGEELLAAANRELQEEVGYGAHELITVRNMTTSPGYWNSNATLIVARSLYESKLPGDEPEPLEVIPWLLTDYRNLLNHEEFTEARNIAALLLVKEMFA
ncbi:MAG: ADP compounds hydrolase NudE [Gammaproteobacteria bacterium]